MHFRGLRFSFAWIFVTATLSMNQPVRGQGNPAENHPPALIPINAVEAQEAEWLGFYVEASDPDLVVPVLSSAPLPDSASFTDNGDYTGTFEWYTDYEDSGTYSVMFYATDGEDPSLVDSMAVQIVVYNVNRFPFARDCPPNQATWVEEGDTLKFFVCAYDFDSEEPILSIYPQLPNFSLMHLGDELHQLTLTPDYWQSGIYSVRFIVHDGDTISYPDDSSYLDYNFSIIDVPLCADINVDGFINISDVVMMIQYLFDVIPVPEDISLIDVNGDNVLTMSDAVEIVDYVFRGGSRPDCTPD